MAQIVSPELEYKKNILSHPTYQLSLLTQQSGGNNITLTNTGGNQSIFELPSTNAYNLANSVLSFTQAFGTAGAYVTGFSGTIASIQQLSLYTRSGIFLCDIPDFQYYTNVTFPTDTPLKEFLDNDQSNLFFRNNISEPSFGYNFGGATNSTAATSSILAKTALSDQRNGGGVVNTAATAASTATTSTRSSLYDTEPAYIIQNQIENVTASALAATIVYTSPFIQAAGPLSIDVKIYGSQIKNTIFALDKDLIFNEILLLRIIWGPYTNLGFRTTAAWPALTAVTAPTEGTITNLAYYLAVEQDASIVNALRAKTATSEGFSTLLDYVYPQLYTTGTLAANGNVNFSYKFNRGNGRKLKRVYNAAYVPPFGTSTAAVTTFCHPNILSIGTDATTAQTTTGTAGSIISYYYTMLDNQRIQQFNVDCTSTTNLDYMIHKDLLNGSVLQNKDVYRYNWVMVDSWDGKRLIEHDANDETGLDLNIEKKWDFYGTLPSGVLPTAPLTFHTYAITQKMLTVSPAGITVL